MKWNDKKVLEHVRRHFLDKLEVVGKFVEDAAVLLVPTDTGYLKGSIQHKVHKEDMSVTIGAYAEYAPYIEFGTGEFAENKRGRKGGWVYYYKGKKGKQGYRFTFGNKPQPFLRPARDNSKKEIKRILER